MHIEIEIDDVLLAQATRVTGLKTKEAVVNEALRRLVCRAQVEAIEAMKGLCPDWEGDIRALRKNRELREDLEDIDTAIKRLKNPGRILTMEEAEKELGVDQPDERRF